MKKEIILDHEPTSEEISTFNDCIVITPTMMYLYDKHGKVRGSRSSKFNMKDLTEKNKTKKLKLNNVDVDIDIEIYPLIEALNKVGLETKFCCAGHINKLSEAYISFNLDCFEKVDMKDGHLNIYWIRDYDKSLENYELKDGEKWKIK